MRQDVQLVCIGQFVPCLRPVLRKPHLFLPRINCPFVYTFTAYRKLFVYLSQYKNVPMTNILSFRKLELPARTLPIQLCRLCDELCWCTIEQYRRLNKLVCQEKTAELCWKFRIRVSSHWTFSRRTIIRISNFHDWICIFGMCSVDAFSTCRFV